MGCRKYDAAICQHYGSQFAPSPDFHLHTFLILDQTRPQFKIKRKVNLILMHKALVTFTHLLVAIMNMIPQDHLKISKLIQALQEKVQLKQVRIQERLQMLQKNFYLKNTLMKIRQETCQIFQN